MGNFPTCNINTFCIICKSDSEKNGLTNTDLENDIIQDFYDKKIEKFPINKDLIYNLNINAAKIQEAYRNYKEKRQKQIDSNKNYLEVNLEVPVKLSKTVSSQKKMEYQKSNLINYLEKKELEKRITNDLEKKITLNKKRFITRGSFFSNNSDLSDLSKSQMTLKPEIFGYFLRKSNKTLNYIGEKDKKTQKKNGYGIVTWDDRSKLYGYFKENKIYGICKFLNSQNKSIYSGEYENNIPNGFANYRCADYEKEGYWEKYYLNGIGYEIWEDLSFYQGNYLKNKKNGIGIYRWPDQTIYHGEWKDNKMSGYGIIYYNDKRCYSGEMLNGNMNGFGVFTWPNNQMYIGFFKRDLKSGFGIYTWQMKPLNAFVGFWDKGRQHGVGAKIINGNFKYGYWNNGKKECWLKGEWEIKKHLNYKECVYEKFLYKNDFMHLLKSLDL